MSGIKWWMTAKHMVYMPRNSIVPHTAHNKCRIADDLIQAKQYRKEKHLFEARELAPQHGHGAGPHTLRDAVGSYCREVEGCGNGEKEARTWRFSEQYKSIKREKRSRVTNHGDRGR
jgi:hypothetical protein